jgi:two-component system response regulator YesN
MFNVLIIDDEEWTRGVIKAFGDWEKYGMNIIGEVENGQDAIDILEKTRCNVIITDMNMPGMNGIQLLKIINEMYDKLQVIVISGHDDFVYMKQAILSNVVDYILKPIKPEGLNNALEKCVKILKEKSVNEEIDIFKVVDASIISYSIEVKEEINRFFVYENLDGIKNALEKLKKYLMKNMSSNLSKEIVYNLFYGSVKEKLVKSIREINDDIIDEIHVFKSMLTDDSSFAEFIDQLYLLFSIINSCVKIERKLVNKSTVEKVKDYIDKQYCNEISLNMLANLFAVSKSYLSTAFKSKYDCNVSHYIVKLKMEKAKELIKADENFSIKQISLYVGYKDISYFYRVFKKYYDISPGQMK